MGWFEDLERQETSPDSVDFGVEACLLDSAFQAMKMRPAWKVQLPKGVKAKTAPENWSGNNATHSQI